MCAPHNMIIRSKTRRWRIFNGQKIRCKTYTNAYYCINNLACVRKQLPGTVKINMYMGNFYFQSLTPSHKEVLLQEYLYWNNILKNRDEVRRRGNLKFNEQYFYWEKNWQPSLIKKITSKRLYY